VNIFHTPFFTLQKCFIFNMVLSLEMCCFQCTYYEKIYNIYEVARWRSGRDSDSQPEGCEFESSSGQCVYKMFVYTFSIYYINTFEPQPIKAEVIDKHTVCCPYQKALIG